MPPAAWATTFLTHQLFHYLDQTAPDISRAIDARGLLSGLESFDPPADAAAFLRDPHNWLPEPLLRRTLAVVEQAAQNKRVAYHAARFYFGEGRPPHPSMLELVALAFSDVGRMAANSHLWAGAYTTYLDLQALAPARHGEERELWIVSRLAPGIPPVISLDQFLKGNYEGFTQLYGWVESVACESRYLQHSLDDVAAEFPAVSVQWDGRQVRLLDRSGELLVEGRQIALVDEWTALDPALSVPGAAPSTGSVCPVEQGRARLLVPAGGHMEPGGVTGVEITRGGTLTAGALHYRLNTGDIYGAPYSCYRYQWRERLRVAESAEAAAARGQFSLSLLESLRQARSVQQRLLAATIDREALSTENVMLRRRIEQPAAQPTILGQSRPMKELGRMIELLAATDTTVLIMGETGTGKELVAQAIHRRSPRADGPFLAVNCGALTESLLESELFGHEKGAFTGAVARRRGKFELAHGGTLFLDEIGEVSPAMQVKLLRVLQEREVLRVGGERPVAVDARIVAATNQSLEQMVAAGRFRADLYYRLKVVPVAIAPLRERREDIPLLARHFLDEYAAQLKRPATAIAPEMLTALLDYAWPGNVRELRHAMERAVLLAGDRMMLSRDLLPSEIVGAAAPIAPAVATVAPSPSTTPPTTPPTTITAWLGMGDWAGLDTLLKEHGSLDQVLMMIEWQIVSKAMAAHGGNKSRTARALGRSYRWLRKLESRLQPSARA